MKKFLCAVISMVVSVCAFAEKAPALSDEELDYSLAVSAIDSVGKPYMKNGCIIFTAPNIYRHVGIAFDFENFRTIHSFKIKHKYDIDMKETDAIMFYILKVPEDVQKVNYRMVFDGLWALDPLNSEKSFDPRTNLYLSSFNASRAIPEVTEKAKSGNIRFVYKGESGQKIRLGGSFTHWDSWIYEMKETSPGLYEFELPLAKGTYQYAFYSGINSFIDRANPERCYTDEGKEASLLIVE
ncbi:MAG: glycogen-binding domain-containing protein [Treponema sp.]|nr:glycogen-binding domain-containing protein [Treponema sp.]